MLIGLRSFAGQRQIKTYASGEAITCTGPLRAAEARRPPGQGIRQQYSMPCTNRSTRS